MLYRLVYVCAMITFPEEAFSHNGNYLEVSGCTFNLHEEKFSVKRTQE